MEPMPDMQNIARKPGGLLDNALTLLNAAIKAEGSGKCWAFIYAPDQVSFFRSDDAKDFMSFLKVINKFNPTRE